MKYNVKQAVSGIQGEMDKASKNQVFNRALGGLASGIEGAATQDYNQDRYNTLAGPGGPLAQQKSLFEDMAKSDDKNERLLGKENLARLSIFQAGLTPANMGTFGKDYADQMGSKSMFEPLFELERAQTMANAYGKRYAQQDAEDASFKRAARGAQNNQMGAFGNMGQGIDSLFKGALQLNPFGRQQRPQSTLGTDADLN
jgi:hypothetical protein